MLNYIFSGIIICGMVFNISSEGGGISGHNSNDNYLIHDYTDAVHNMHFITKLLYISIL